jgi:solute carrier family 40 (iron-regulated transporter), member 1
MPSEDSTEAYARGNISNTQHGIEANQEDVITVVPANTAPQTSKDMQYEPSRVEEPVTMTPLPRSLTIRLYISHFLSTWNSRLFEFGAVLFIASIYPETLLPMSVYALVRSGVAIVFSPTVGSWIDHGNRLAVVRVSIIGQRVAVGASCGCFWAMTWWNRFREKGEGKMGLFVAVVVLACVEKLCGVVNLVAVERDWVRDKFSFTLAAYTLSLCRLRVLTGAGSRDYGWQ